MTRAQAVAATSPMPLISTEPKPFDVYEVIDAETSERTAAKLSTRPLLDSAMKRYFDREFEAARALFQEASAEDPEDVVPHPLRRALRAVP